MKTIYKNLIWCILCLGMLLSTSSKVTLAAQSKGQSSRAEKKSSNPSTSQEKVDLNTASKKELDELPGIGPAFAKKIVAGRPYSSVADLSKAGIPASTVEKIAPLVTVGNGSAAKNNERQRTERIPGGSSSPGDNSGARNPASSPTGRMDNSASPANSPAAKETGSTSEQNNISNEQALAQGMVWVNLESGVYHHGSSRYYGKTKKGKYMLEAEAEKAGYRAAKNEK